jgi:hypothetical protein
MRPAAPREIMTHHPLDIRAALITGHVGSQPGLPHHIVHQAPAGTARRVGQRRHAGGRQVPAF